MLLMVLHVDGCDCRRCANDKAKKVAKNRRLSKMNDSGCTASHSFPFGVMSTVEGSTADPFD